MPTSQSFSAGETVLMSPQSRATSSSPERSVMELQTSARPSTAPSQEDFSEVKTIREEPTLNEEKDVEPSQDTAPENTGPPDGGLRAWLVVAGCACAGFSTFGFANAYGVFQAYYAQTLPGATPSSIAWIGSLQYCLVFLPGLASGWLVDRGYFRLPIFVASLIQIAAIFLVAECKQLWQLVLCQGIVIGASSGFVFLPSLSVIPQWFSNRRARAYGIIAVGSSIGGAILPIVIRKLLVAVGFKWTIRILGFILMSAMGFFNLAIKQRLTMSKQASASVPALALFKNKTWVWYTVGITLIWFGLYAPLQFFDVSAQHIGISKDISFYTIVTANAASAIGRVSSGFWADSFGAMNVLILFSLISALMIIVWPYAQTFASLLVVAAIYGISSGAFIGLLPAATSRMVPPQQLGRAIGLASTIMSLGALFGTPISGAIYSASGGFKAVGGFAGGMVLIACMAISVSRYHGLGGWIGKI